MISGHVFLQRREWALLASLMTVVSALTAAERQRLIPLSVLAANPHAVGEARRPGRLDGVGASLDPEYARDLLDRFYDAMEAEIALGGGTVEKFIGDAVVAVFGAPAPRRTTPSGRCRSRSGCRNGCRSSSAAGCLSGSASTPGEVAVGRPREGSSFATGDAVNVAARLEQAAEPGGPRWERTASLVGGAFELGEPRTVRRKGRRAASPAGSSGGCARRGGRAAGTAWKRGSWVAGASSSGSRTRLARTHADGRPRLAAVVGEAGMGKTSLVREFRERLPAGAAFRLGRCLSYGRGVTYSALADVLRQQLGLRQEDSAEATLERLAGREILGLTLGLDVAGDLDPRAAAAAAAGPVGAADLAARRGGDLRCWCIEDLHWAAEPLLEVLERVLSDADGPVLVLATMRPGAGWYSRRRTR